MPVARFRKASRAIVYGGIFLIILVATLGCVEIYLDHQRAEEAAFSRLENLARIADEGISGRMRTIDLMLRDVGREAQIARSADDEEALVAYMKARAATFEEVRTLSISDRNGVIVHTTLPQVQGFDARNRAYFVEPRAAPNRDRLFISGPVKATTGSVILFASRPKEPVRGDWDGVAVASLPPAYFASILATMRPQNEGFATLLGVDGTIIARSPEQDRFIGVNVGSGPAHIAHVASGQRVTRMRAVMDVTDSRDRFVVNRTTDFPQLLVAIGWDADEALAGWRRNALTKGVVVVALCVFMGALLRVFFGHERELRDQRNFATSLIDSANVMVVGLDAEGRIAIFNDAAEELTGHAKADVLGRSWFETLMPRDRFADIEEPFAYAVRRGLALPRQFEGPILTRDGDERIVAWQNSFEPAAGLASVSFGIDMTDRLAVERELVESQRFIKAITDNMPGMVGYWDADLRCRFANRAYLEWFGKDASEIVGHSIRDLMGERLYALNEPHIQAALNGVPQHFERTLVRADGEVGYTWAHYIPDVDRYTRRVVGFFVLVADVTALKHAEVQLKVLSGRLALATRAGGIGVWDLEPGNGRLVWDDRMFDLYGIDPASGGASYEMWRSCCHPDDVDRVTAELKAALDGTDTFDTEFRIVTPAGVVRHIKAAALVESDTDSPTGRMVGINYDITAIREGEKALASAKARAELANRAKSEFLANMSHEIRTPMNAVMGLCHLLAGTDLDGAQRDFVTKIDAAARSLLGIINDILDFSKVEAGRLELETSEFRLSDIMDGLASVMSVNASVKDLELVIDVDGAVPDRLVGDPLRLQQVLVNLTGNAIKFTHAGEVAIHVARIGGQGGGQGAGVVLRFEVVDTGIGIAAADRTRLFEAFSQADSSTTRRFGGSGLGLAISKRLIDLMGGTIDVTSEPGRGSTFHFTVPFEPAPIHEEADPPATGTHFNLLIVDDHDGGRRALSAAASAMGWTAACASSGEEGLALVRERTGASAPFDVLVVDWSLPGMDGLAFARQIRAIGGLESTPVVALVTAFHREAMTASPDIDCTDTVLVKPVTPSMLLNAVTTAKASRQRRVDGPVRPPRPAPREGRGLGGARLLLVEDNAINQEVARRILELEGAVIVVANNGAEALSLLKASPEAFDAVLMDIQMPVMDGYETTRRIRRTPELKALPVIALTAGALASERQRAHDAGMDDFITKPFDVGQMIRIIRHHAGSGDPASADPTNSRAPAAPSLSPVVDGIDMATASERLSGNDALFASLLKALVQEFDGTVAAVRGEWQAGNAGGAIRRLHALRGAAGNIAAGTVVARAWDLESAMRDGDTGAIDGCVARLDGAMASLFAAIRRAELRHDAVGRPAGTAERLDGARLQALIDRLDRRDMNAVDAFLSLRAAIAGAVGRDRMLDIEAAIDALRFADAAALLRACRDELMASPEKR